MEINEKMTMNDAIKISPAAVKIFGKYNMDSCCGGFQEIGAAAKAGGVDLDKLMKELRESAKQGAVS
ncbi:MAG: DUF542 domain-containing protein [Nitrospinae bacterium]|nr:DUF542 domain-containing protein [Nitrospinota bacterium]